MEKSLHVTCAPRHAKWLDSNLTCRPSTNQFYRGIRNIGERGPRGWRGGSRATDKFRQRSRSSHFWILYSRSSKAHHIYFTNYKYNSRMIRSLQFFLMLLVFLPAIANAHKLQRRPTESVWITDEVVMSGRRLVSSKSSKSSSGNARKRNRRREQLSVP